VSSQRGHSSHHLSSNAFIWALLPYRTGDITPELDYLHLQVSPTQIYLSLQVASQEKKEEDCKIATGVSSIKCQILHQLVWLTFPLRKYFNNILIISLEFGLVLFLFSHVEKIMFLNI